MTDIRVRKLMFDDRQYRIRYYRGAYLLEKFDGDQWRELERRDTGNDMLVATNDGSMRTYDEEAGEITEDEYVDDLLDELYGFYETEASAPDKESVERVHRG